MSRGRFLDAALIAAERGWCVFPLIPGEKTPTLRDWEGRATSDRRQIRRWWAGDAQFNIGIAVGRSGLVVIDLDGGRGEKPPQRFASARDGRDVLAMLAAEAGAEMPTDTYTVDSPGGSHLYFRTPTVPRLRNTIGKLGWRIDSRGHGGYVVGAGSQRADRLYREVHGGPVAELPRWLADRLAPAQPADPAPPLQLPGRRANAYVLAIVQGESREVAAAEIGHRHHALLKAARTLGRLIGGGELSDDEARQALLDASARHIGVENYTATEVQRTIDDGIAYGKKLPRRINRVEGNGLAATGRSRSSPFEFVHGNVG